MKYVLMTIALLVGVSIGAHFIWAAQVGPDGQLLQFAQVALQEGYVLVTIMLVLLAAAEYRRLSQRAKLNLRSFALQAGILAMTFAFSGSSTDHWIGLVVLIVFSTATVLAIQDAEGRIADDTNMPVEDWAAMRRLVDVGLPQLGIWIAFWICDANWERTGGRCAIPALLVVSLFAGLTLWVNRRRTPHQNTLPAH